MNYPTHPYFSLVCFAFGDSDYLYKFWALPWLIPIIGPSIGFILELVQSNNTLCAGSSNNNFVEFGYIIPANLFTIINIIMWFAVLQKVYAVLRSNRRQTKQRRPATSETSNIDFESRNQGQGSDLLARSSRSKFLKSGRHQGTHSMNPDTDIEKRNHGLVRAAIILMPLFGVHSIIFTVIPTIQENPYLYHLLSFLQECITPMTGIMIACVYCFANDEVQHYIKMTIVSIISKNDIPQEESIFYHLRRSTGLL